MSLTETFYKTIAFTVINKYGKGAVLDISTKFGRIYHVALKGSSEKGLFRHWSNRVFAESVISEIHQLWGSSFFKKYSKFKLDFKNAEKNSEKVFCFRDTCIWIGCVKLSLLRREYLPSALSVLGNSLEILHITNRDFL